VSFVIEVVTVAPALQVRNLSVRYEAACFRVPAVRDVSFDLDKGRVVGILGESGCGKTTLAISLLQLLPTPGEIVSGSIRLNGRELIGSPEKSLGEIRGREIAMVFQEPAISLSPVMRVGSQIANILLVHRRWSRSHREEYTKDLLAAVGLSDVQRIYRAYPHELSSGQQQRIAIAQAIACEPSILIADEPTANLDTDTASQVLRLLLALKDRIGFGILLVTHNPALLAESADRVLVMYAGQVVEQAPCKVAFQNPLHPYTAALMRCIRGNRPQATRLASIPGEPPDITRLPDGCAFALRCASRIGICDRVTPEVAHVTQDHAFRCFNPGVLQ
jgi:oligopeptide/dipeptide ABC transporter ATP-binding protein